MQSTAAGAVPGITCMTIFSNTPPTIVFNTVFSNYFKMRWDSVKSRIGFVQRF